MTNAEISELLNLNKVLDATHDRLRQTLAKFEDLSLHFLALQAESKGLRAELGAFRAQLAALQSEDELPELPKEFEVFTEDCPNAIVHGYTSEDMEVYARQAQTMVRAKMATLKKGAARYQEIREVLTDLMEWQVKNVKVWNHPTWDNAQAVIDCHNAAMGITGEPK